jgi:hypothetical protein
MKIQKEFPKGTKLQAIVAGPFGTSVPKGTIVIADGKGKILQPKKYSHYYLPHTSGIMPLEQHGFRLITGRNK